ncbi:MAG: DNA polymerase IV [Thermoplasmata archaeon]|nr:MAG: DNA polymerase IV [Thermoplasmata archaeon]
MSEGIRTIFHLDMDSFYASVEEREHPEHFGKPIIIGADPKGGSGRGVVAACSYAARKFGVRSAMPISQAYRLCPEGIYIRPRFDLYEQVSDEIMDYLKTFTDKIEQVSIDEAYMDVSEKVGEYDSAKILAEEIQRGVKEKFNLTCSIGIAHNKSIAKIASDYNKPAGITHVKYERFQGFLDPLGVEKISGVGPKTQDILNGIGITTIQELREAKKHVLYEELGKYGFYLQDIASGLENEEVHTSGHLIKSVSHESTFMEDTSDFSAIEERISDMTRYLCKELSEKQIYYKTVTLKIRFEDFETLTRSKSLSLHSRSYMKAYETALELLKEFENSQMKIRLIGVKLSNLKTLDDEQKTLEKWV